MAIKVIMNS